MDNFLRRIKETARDGKIGLPLAEALVSGVTHRRLLLDAVQKLFASKQFALVTVDDYDGHSVITHSSDEILVGLEAAHVIVSKSVREADQAGDLDTLRCLIACN